jgi:hypothetical protein
VLDRIVRRVILLIFFAGFLYAAILIIWFGDGKQRPRYVSRKGSAEYKEFWLSYRTPWRSYMVSKPSQRLKIGNLQWVGTTATTSKSLNVTNLTNRILDSFTEYRFSHGRREYFHAYNNFGTKYEPIKIVGWHVTLQSISPKDDGFVVEVLVAPRFAGRSVTAGGAVLETWYFDGQELTFIDRCDDEAIHFATIFD